MRLAFLLIALAAATSLLGLASLAGRGIPSALAVASLDKSRPELVAYLIADLSRGLIARRTIPLPDGVDARWHAQPPLVLQRATREAYADWTLSRVELNSRALVPLMTLTTPDSARIRIPDMVVRALPDGRLHVSVYVPQTGGIWVSTSDSPRAVLLANVRTDHAYPLNWSPDGSKLAVKSAYQTGMTVIDVADGSPREFDVPVNTWPVWSPDSTRILLVPSQTDDYGLPLMVADVRDGALDTPFTGSSGVWCGDHLYYSDVRGGVRSLFRGDPATGESVTVLSSAMHAGFDPVIFRPLRADACEWLLVHQNRLAGSLLLHTPSARVIPLGLDVRVLAADGDMLVFQALGEELIEIRRMTLQPDVTGYETLAAFPRPYIDARWIGDWRRGLVNDFGSLALLELPSGDVRTLTAGDISEFSLLDE